MIHKLLSDKKIVLASASPRREALLKMLQLTPLIIPARVDEPITGEKPYLQAMRHARNKAQTIAARMDAETLVIGADTIVVLDGVILGKPADQRQAGEYLNLLSGRTHKVYTGLCLCWRKACFARHERSLVEFAPLSETEIQAYVETGEPLDKAGAYGIQGYGSQFIRRIQGCYFNVMGFPIHLFYKMLGELFKENAL
ncbi:MAG: Maf family protein [Candidatus Cloacimonetes bacterium]|jgi:septum formation protein|nr:Maf family protein [Candidatus Cloacimonadota bacterium]MDY0366487.1 Maf family protein [Candidatus Syntrophosphaera sp.]